jgi:translation initiation factor IF-2
MVPLGSIMYKTKLPFILAFNKTDVKPHDFAVEWMTDFEAFQEAARADTTYMGSLTASMSLVLEEFYKTLKVVGMSAISGEGMTEFFEAVDGAVEEYNTEYLPALQKVVSEREAEKEKEKTAQLDKLMSDMDLKKGGDEI